MAWNDLYPYKAVIQKGAETFEHTGHAETAGLARREILRNIESRKDDVPEKLIGFEFNGKEMPVSE